MLYHVTYSGGVLYVEDLYWEKVKYFLPLPLFPTPVILQNWHPVATSNQLISYPYLLLPPPPFHFQIIGATTNYVSPYHSTLCYYRKYFKSFAVQWNECEEFC